VFDNGGGGSVVCEAGGYYSNTSDAPKHANNYLYSYERLTIDGSGNASVAVPHSANQWNFNSNNTGNSNVTCTYTDGEGALFQTVVSGIDYVRLLELESWKDLIGGASGSIRLQSGTLNDTFVIGFRYEI